MVKNMTLDSNDLESIIGFPKSQEVSECNTPIMSPNEKEYGEWFHVNNMLPPPYPYNSTNVSETVLTAVFHEGEWIYAMGSYWYKQKYFDRKDGFCFKAKWWQIPTIPQIKL